MKATTEIRVTFPRRYPDSVDITGRQGYYFYGDDLNDCISKACKKYPNEMMDIEKNGEWLGYVISNTWNNLHHG